jgi:hypothetical protein
MNQVKPKNATTIAGLLDERSEGIAARYDFRSYRCALHIGATLVRPRTVHSRWQGFPVSQEHRSCPPFHCLFDSILLSSAQEAAHFALRKEPNYFTRLNN